MAALLPLAALAKAPPHDAKTLTMDPPRIVREKAMHRHEQAGKKDDKWPPDGKSRKFYKALKELAPKSETTKIVLVSTLKWALRDMKSPKGDSQPRGPVNFALSTHSLPMKPPRSMNLRAR